MGFLGNKMGDRMVCDAFNAVFFKATKLLQKRVYHSFVLDLLFRNKATPKRGFMAISIPEALLLVR